MTGSNTSLDDLAASLLSAAPTLDVDEQRLVVALYRSLTRGSPVVPAGLAGELDVSVERIEKALRTWPGVYRDRDGAVIGFWGLALADMPHDLETEQGTVTAWCALDPFLIAPLLGGEPAKVRSSDPVTGQRVSLTITPGGPEAVTPPAAMVSMLRPDIPFGHDVVATFCHRVWFFASPESGRRWLEEHPDSFLLTIHEADEVARRSRPALVRDALRTPPAQTSSGEAP